MKPGMKMLMISGMDKKRDNEYDMESRYRDSRGREHRESGRYAPRSDYMNDYPMTDNYDGETRMGGYPNRPFPVYEGGRSNMNPIGFNVGSEVRTDYGMNATHYTDKETEYRSSPKMSGGSSSNMSMPMTKEIAEEWTSGMKNEDGTKGPHWKMDQVKQLMMQKGIEYNPWEFYAILNAMYSDYCAVFKKHGVNTMDMYVDLACAFLNDSDAMPNKSMLYYECIVKK